MVDRIMAPQKMSTVSSVGPRNLLLHTAKRDFADVIKVKDLKIEELTLIIGVLKIREPFPGEVREKCNDG